MFKKPLGLFSQKPMTGFFRDGYCRTGPDDVGNHAVAGMSTPYNIISLEVYGQWSRCVLTAGLCNTVYHSDRH